MTKLNSVEALDKRNELVEYGFTVVPEVMPESLVNQLRIWSDAILNHVTIDRKIHCQGCDIFVYTERLWFKANQEVKPNYFLIHLLKKSSICRFRKKFVV